MNLFSDEFEQLKYLLALSDLYFIITVQFIVFKSKRGNRNISIDSFLLQNTVPMNIFIVAAKQWKNDYDEYVIHSKFEEVNKRTLKIK